MQVKRRHLCICLLGGQLLTAFGERVRPGAVVEAGAARLAEEDEAHVALEGHLVVEETGLQVLLPKVTGSLTS